MKFKVIVVMDGDDVANMRTVFSEAFYTRAEAEAFALAIQPIEGTQRVWLWDGTSLISI